MTMFIEPTQSNKPRSTFLLIASLSQTGGGTP